MNKFLLLLSLLTISTFQAQETAFRTTDANVALAELKAEAYPKDSTANAFYIFEEGYTRFVEDRGLKLVTDYTAKIKILNQEGYESANISIHLSKNNREKEKIRTIKATTYYLEDGVQKSEELNPSDVYTEENPKYDLVKFTFPALRPGAVIVYSYEKESPFFFNFETWWFQEDIPKVYSKFTTRIPGNFNYNAKKIGHQELDIHDEKIINNCLFRSAHTTAATCVETVYVMEYIPAFVEENYLTSKYNFLSRIDYELVELTNLRGEVTKYTKTWKDVDKELRTDRDFGRQLRNTSAVKKLLPEEISSQPNSLLKAQAIYNFVKDNYKWNGDYRIFDRMRVKELLEEKTGNVSSINTLLHNIYKEQGYSVWPVLSSTRANGFPTQLYPVLSEFNYLTVQLQVGSEFYNLDATEKYANFGDLPFRSLNRYARLLDFDKGSEWIETEPRAISTLTFRDSLKINIDGTSTGISQHHYTGHHALSARNTLDGLPETDVFNTMSNPNNHTRASKIHYSNKTEAAEPLMIAYDLTNQTQKINDRLYINPFSFKFFSKNPFQLEERTYPVDFGYKDVYSYSINLQIPEGHEVLELPEQQVVGLPENGGSIQFLVQQVDEKNVNIHCRVTFPKAVYEVGYYPYLKEFFNKIVEIQEQSVVVIAQKS